MPYICPYPHCNVICSTLYGLKYHARSHDLTSGKCPLCGEEFEKLRTHLLRNPDPDHIRLSAILSINGASMSARKKLRERIILLKV